VKETNHGDLLVQVTAWLADHIVSYRYFVMLTGKYSKLTSNLAGVETAMVERY